MKEGIHPNYREVCFQDMSNGFKFVTRSCANTKEMGKTDEAIVAYREVIANYPDGASASRARLALGGLLEARNEFQQAFGFYDQLGATAWASEAGARRQALLASHPELAPPTTNSPEPALTLPGVAVPPAASN